VPSASANCADRDTLRRKPPPARAELVRLLHDLFGFDVLTT
jgi:hypothetical protein